MTESEPTPTQQLAQEIAQELVKAKLLAETRSADLVGKIAAGKVKPDDWALWIELAGDAAAKESKNG